MGLKVPMVCRPGYMSLEDIRGLNGPKRPFGTQTLIQRGWARGPGDGLVAKDPWMFKRPPRPKLSRIVLGFGKVENWPRRPMNQDMAKRPFNTTRGKFAIDLVGLELL
ncbi:hypothetical protein O181_031590 [Austropuccinia psidii MF-1]|uniref:Uncharacterized protein n=1 Tax=Austropuccinia psidii MF-1 TaxID=1389203 RepID=A0A9Q3H7D3_9BASI|nr:hypothetical protein [Austropuccinia psidii MF-1]